MWVGGVDVKHQFIDDNVTVIDKCDDFDDQVPFVLPSPSDH